MIRLEKKSPQKTLISFAASLLALVFAFTLYGCGGGGSGGSNAAVMPTPGGGSGGTGGGSEQGMPGGGGTGSGGSVETSEWILPGTVASTTARDEFSQVAAISDGPGFSAEVGISKYGGVLVTAGPIILEHQVDHWEWGYWAQDALSSDITKYQTRYEPMTVSNYPEDNSVVGIMSNGIFYITRGSRVDEQYPIHNETIYEAGWISNDNIPPHQKMEELPHIFHINARWSGDALGWKKDTKAPVYGPAELSITSSRRVRDTVDFDFLFNTNWNNGDSASFSFRLSGIGSVGNIVGNNVKGNLVFAGPNSEEVLGTFDGSRYLGSFGLKRR